MPSLAPPRATGSLRMALCSSHPDATKITRHHTKRPPNETPLATGARDRQPPLAHLVALGLPPTGRKSARKCPPRKRFSGCSTGRWNDGPRGRIVGRGGRRERKREKGRERGKKLHPSSSGATVATARLPYPSTLAPVSSGSPPPRSRRGDKSKG